MKDFKELLVKPRKVALYASFDIDTALVLEINYSRYDEHYSLLPEGQMREKPIQGCVRISEPMEVTFQGIDNDEVIQKAVESLDAEERKAIEDLNAKIADIRERKSQLLALTHESAS